MGPADRATATDGALLRTARTDPDAFGELYARHEAIVVAALVRQTRDAELAADLTGLLHGWVTPDLTGHWTG